MAHTPGPWRHEIDKVFSGDTCQATLIADCNPIGDHFASTAEANARLIAAAPELLEALRRLTIDLNGIANANQVPGHVAYHSKLGMADIAQRALAAVETAIAKAEGK